MSKFKTSYLIILVVMLCSSCSTLRYPQGITYRSSIEQELLWQSMERACSNLFNTDEEQHLVEQINDLNIKIKDYQKSPNSYYSNPIAARDVLQKSLNKLKSKNPQLELLTGKTVFLNIQAEPNEVYSCTNILENVLTKDGMTVVSSEKEADYKLTAVVQVNGIDETAYVFPIFYWSDTLKAKTYIHVKLIASAISKVVYDGTLTGYAHYERGYILSIFGPVVDSSLEEPVVDQPGIMTQPDQAEIMSHTEQANRLPAPKEVLETPIIASQETLPKASNESKQTLADKSIGLTKKVGSVNVFIRPDIDTSSSTILVFPMMLTDGKKLMPSNITFSNPMANALFLKKWSDDSGAKNTIAVPKQGLDKIPDAYSSIDKLIASCDTASAVEQTTQLTKFFEGVTSTFGDGAFAFALILEDEKEYKSSNQVHLNMGVFDTKKLTWQWITKDSYKNMGMIQLPYQLVVNKLISDSYDAFQKVSCKYINDKESLGGIGVIFKRLTVTKVITDTPASKFGILEGDQIIEVDGTSLLKPDGTVNLDGPTLKDKLQGAVGTKVCIKILRKGIQEPISLTLTREIIQKSSHWIM